MNRHEEAAYVAVLRELNMPTDGTETWKQPLARRLVQVIGEHMRAAVEDEYRGSGRLRNDDTERERRERFAHASIADYCRNKRLAIEAAKDVIRMREPWGLLLMLGVDEAHYRRLASLPTKAEAERQIQRGGGGGGAGGVLSAMPISDHALRPQETYFDNIERMSGVQAPGDHPVARHRRAGDVPEGR